jgi:hypothetical protein
MSSTKKSHEMAMGQMEFPCISSNQNQIPTLGLKIILAPKK